MKYFFPLPVALSILIFILTACNTSENKNQRDHKVADSSNVVRYELITASIKSPAQLEASPDNTHRLFISDLGGKIFILKNGKLLSHPFIDVSSRLEQKDTAPDMRAVYSLAFHPQFAANKNFYICYNAPANNDSDICKLVVSEFKASETNPDAADLSSERKVFEAEGKTIGKDDCQIEFGPDGYLYISIGDNGTPLAKREAQDLSSYYGKLLRIDVDKIPYGIPADNPFVHNKNARPEIWAYGLRRLWRYSFDPQTNLFIGADVGDKMQEEIDILQKGGNYGWPVKEGDSLAVKNTSADTLSFIQPVSTYTHQTGVCIIGGSIYRGKAMPFLEGKYVFGDLNGSLFALQKNSAGEWTRQNLKPANAPKDPVAIFSVDKDDNNELYILGELNTDEGSKGVVYKLLK